jgi:hypothetical protein
MACIYNPSYAGDIGRRIMVPGQPRQKCKILLENNSEEKSAEGVAQVLECLPSKCKALSPNPSSAKRKTKKFVECMRKC